MNEFLNGFIELAKQYKNPDSFLQVVNESIRCHPDSIYNTAVGLYEHSYFSHSIRIMELALEYDLKNKNLQGQATCFNICISLKEERIV